MPEYKIPGVYIEEVEIGVKPIRGVSTSLAGFLGETERGPENPILISSFGDYMQFYGGYLPNSYLTYAVDGFFRNGGKNCYIARICSSDSDPSTLDLDIDGTNSIKMTAVGPGDWGNRIWAKIENATLQSSFLFKLTLLYYSTMPPVTIVDPTESSNRNDPNRREPDVIEVYDNLSIDPKSPDFYIKKVNGTSKIVVLSSMIHGRPINVALTALSWGNSGSAISISDYNPTGSKTNSLGEIIYTGLAGFKKIDEISIVCAPNENGIPTLRDAIVSHCEELKDRFAVLQTKENDANNIDTLRPGRESKYAALYFPWLKVLDPLTNSHKLIPPGGHIAGIYARSDTERGVHKAPANEALRGVAALQVNLNKEQQSKLNPRGVNVIRAFPGRGHVVWGARTISTDPLWKYINIRRLFLYIEESIEEATQWVIFEPNNERLWTRITAAVTQFLTRVWRDGALMGTTPEEAFFVKCDRSTMTQDDIDNGRLIVLIGVAPVKPAEFVIFRIGQTAAGAEVTEL